MNGSFNQIIEDDNMDHSSPRPPQRRSSSRGSSGSTSSPPRHYHRHPPRDNSMKDTETHSLEPPPRRTPSRRISSPHYTPYFQPIDEQQHSSASLASSSRVIASGSVSTTSSVYYDDESSVAALASLGEFNVSSSLPPDTNYGGGSRRHMPEAKALPVIPDERSSRSRSTEPEVRDDVEQSFDSTVTVVSGEPGTILADSGSYLDQVSHVEVFPKSVDVRKRIVIVALIAVALAAIIATTVSVAVSRNRSSSGSTSSGGTTSPPLRFTPIIGGLCSPRHLKVYDDKLFVAEAGVGPVQIAGDIESENLCLPSTLNAISSGICFGETGQISVYHLNGTRAARPPLTGLISGRPVLGSFTNQVLGVAAVDFDDDGSMFTLLGSGYVDAKEMSEQAPELDFAAVLKGDRVVAEPWKSLLVQDDTLSLKAHRTNPFHMLIYEGVTYIVDSGTDLLYTYFDIEAGGDPDSIVAIPKIENVPALRPDPDKGVCVNDEAPPLGPSYCGMHMDGDGNWMYSVNPVPTAVRINPLEPDRIYIGYLSGTIWNHPISGIYFMDLVNGIPQPDTLQTIRGFWAVVDFDFYGNDIYVLETYPGGFVPFQGRLSKVALGNDQVAGFQVITENLYQPVGMIIHNDTLYVSNNTFNMAIDDCDGQILRSDLR